MIYRIAQRHVSWLLFGDDYRAAAWYALTSESFDSPAEPYGEFEPTFAD